VAEITKRRGDVDMDIEERMLKVEREGAINSQKTETHRNELNELYTMLRKHMAKEEEQRQELIGLISNLSSRLNSQKSFWGGIVFTVGGLGAVIVVVAKWFLDKT